jgi:hypothetical protein
MSDSERSSHKSEHKHEGGYVLGHGGHGLAEAEHLGHHAHRLHLLAHGMEAGAHAKEFVKHAEAARKLLKTVGQMGYDIRRMKRGVAALENAAKQGGRVGAKAMARLSKAKQALALAEEEYWFERGLVGEATTVIHEYKVAQSAVRGAALVKLGQAAARLETALGASRVGRVLLTTGKVTSSKPFVNGLVVIGAGLEAVASYADSTAETTTGKAVNAVLGGVSVGILMKQPVAALGDVFLPTGYKLSEVYHGGAGAVTAIGEGVLKWDTKAMDAFHKRSMEGHYGKVMQAASEAGEYWSEKGISGGFREFAEAVRWWVGH